MRFFRQKKIAYLVMISTSGSLLAAQTLPLLPVDPALLGRDVPANPRGSGRSEKGRTQIVLPVISGVTAATPQAAAPSPARTMHPAEAVAVAPASDESNDQLVLATEPVLKLSRHMAPLRKNKLEPGPIFIAADRISGRSNVDTLAEGHVELRKVGDVLTADRLSYREDEDLVDAVGNVRIHQNDDVITGPRLHLKITDSIGFFEQPKYSIKRQIKDAAPGQTTTGSGAAQRIDFEGENRYKLTDATYSTCGPVDPDWFARAKTMELDYDKDNGEAHDVTLVFKGMPILYSPWLSFPLNNRRKSGFLLPTLGSTSKSGFEVLEPYYWNIAPNMDATISPRLMSKRGVELNGELRYLDQNYSGIFQGEYLPNDQITHSDRSSYSFQHNQNLGMGFSTSLNLNGVSDDTFFSDLSSRLANISQTTMLREGAVAYASDWWNVRAMAQRYRTLQDPALPPVVQPYSRLPQISLNAFRSDLPAGGAFTFNGDYVYFSHSSLVEGARTSVYPQLSLPMQTSAYFITPKIGLNATSYKIDPHSDGESEHISRNLPIFSVDGGVFLERNVDWFDQGVIQTLEPRMFYLYVPYRDQGRIPIFDTGLSDFGASQLFAENRYSGNDRIGDANQLSVTMTSRFLNQDTGAELLRATVGQQYYFKSQRVTLPGEIPRTSNTADFLAMLSGKLSPTFSIETGLQYSPHTNRINLLSLTAQYQPGSARAIAAGYRYNRSAADPVTGLQSEIKQIDIAGQWPLWKNWSGVGRYNYSLVDHRIIESVGGVEYNAGCWVSRLVLHRMATGVSDSSTSMFVQLELNGFSNIGSNPMDVLKRNVPGYSRINLPGVDPVSPGIDNPLP